MHHKKAITGVLQANLSIFDTILLYAYFSSSDRMHFRNVCMQFIKSGLKNDQAATNARMMHYRCTSILNAEVTFDRTIVTKARGYF